MTGHRSLGFRIAALVSGAAWGIACSSTMDVSELANTIADAGSPDGASADPIDKDKNKDAPETFPARSRYGTTCGAEGACTGEDEVCVQFPGATSGICTQKCSTSTQCKEAYGPSTKCASSGFCLLTCSNASDCEGTQASICDGQICFSSCQAHPGLCGDQLTCEGESCREAPLPDGGPNLPCEKTPSSGLSSSATLAELTSAQRDTLCDWQACQLGGYGDKATCPQGLSTNPPASRAKCRQQWPEGCSATVAELEACQTVIAADRCSGVLLKAPECAALRACAGL